MKICFLALLAFLAQTFVAPQAFCSTEAVTADTRILVRGGGYGLLGGTLVGLAALPLTGSSRGIFIGSSLGLYAGLMLGVYQIIHRDPALPLHGEERPDFDPAHVEEIQLTGGSLSPQKQPLTVQANLSMPVYTF